MWPPFVTCLITAPDASSTNSTNFVCFVFLRDFWLIVFYFPPPVLQENPTCHPPATFLHSGILVTTSSAPPEIPCHWLPHLHILFVFLINWNSVSSLHFSFNRNIPFNGRWWGLLHVCAWTHAVHFLPQWSENSSALHLLYTQQKQTCIITENLHFKWTTIIYKLYVYLESNHTPKIYADNVCRTIWVQWNLKFCLTGAH